MYNGQYCTILHGLHWHVGRAPVWTTMYTMYFPCIQLIFLWTTTNLHMLIQAVTQSLKANYVPYREEKVFLPNVRILWQGKRPVTKCTDRILQMIVKNMFIQDWIQDIVFSGFSRSHFCFVILISCPSDKPFSAAMWVLFLTKLRSSRHC